MIMTKDKRGVFAVSLDRGIPRDGQFVVRSAEDAADIAKRMKKAEVDYVLVGSMLPARSAAELCRLIVDAAGNLSAPVYLLKTCAKNPAAGREQGTDKRDGRGIDSTRGTTRIMVDIDRHEVLVDQRAIDVTATEFRLLALFAQDPGRVFSRDQIIEHIRGKGYACTRRCVDVLIVSLRRKLGEEGKCIQTVRGIGYRYREK